MLKSYDFYLVFKILRMFHLNVVYVYNSTPNCSWCCRRCWMLSWELWALGPLTRSVVPWPLQPQQERARSATFTSYRWSAALSYSTVVESSLLLWRWTLFQQLSVSLKTEFLIVKSLLYKLPYSTIIIIRLVVSDVLFIILYFPYKILSEAT